MTKRQCGMSYLRKGTFRVGDVVRSSLELVDPYSGFSLAPNAYIVGIMGFGMTKGSEGELFQKGDFCGSETSFVLV